MQHLTNRKLQAKLQIKKDCDFVNQVLITTPGYNFEQEDQDHRQSCQHLGDIKGNN